MSNEYFPEENNPKISYLRVTKKNGDQVDFIVDTKNVPKLQEINWFATAKGYLKTEIGGRHISMPEILYGKRENGKVYDHINRETTDYRECNLRYISIRGNVLNRRQAVKGKSGIYGIFVDGKYGYYRVRDCYGQTRNTKNLAKAVFIRIQNLVDAGLTVSEAYAQMRILSNPESINKLEKLLSSELRER